MLPDPQPGWSLSDWLAYQERLHPQAIALGLERVRRVAERLGLLQQPPLTLTVGGTNGKGSTTTLLSLIYREAGYRVGAYTSPHLFRYNERVAVDGQPVSDAALCRAFEAIEQMRAGEALTYFEYGTLAALWLFREAKVDVQVLEVGLGGRLDAVNLLDADAALVTQIGLDHQDWLGSDRDQIGREKAGIFRPARPAVIADRQPPGGLLSACAEIAPALWRFDQQDYGYAVEGDVWHWQGPHGVSPPLPRPALDGLHQFDNAAGAIALVQRLHARASVEWPAVQRALRRLQLPGRMQWQGRFLLDVAHNAEAAQAVAALLRTRQPDAKALWIAGLFADKPLEAIAAALAPVVERAITCDLPSSRALAAPELAARLSAAGLPAEAAGAPSRALHRALQQARPDQTILVCGSFLTVAAVAPLIADARTDD